MFQKFDASRLPQFLSAHPYPLDSAPVVQPQAVSIRQALVRGQRAKNTETAPSSSPRMASTRGRAAPLVTPAGRRKPMARGAPAAPATTKSWGPEETARLKKLHAEVEDPVDWDELAERLRTGRTWKQVQSKATALGLRQREPAAAGGPAWEAQRAVQGDTNKKREAAASAAPTLMSPVNPPPSEPRQHRPAAAAAALAIKQSALDGDAADTLTGPQRACGRCTRTLLGQRSCFERSAWQNVENGSSCSWCNGAAARLLLLLLCCCAAAGHMNFGVLLGALGGILAK